MINNRPVTGYMLLGLALEYVECFNREEAPIILQCFERVVSIESERVIEELYEEIIESIDTSFNFPPLTDSKLPFENLEKVYSIPEMDKFVAEMMTYCDLEFSKRLKTILSVKNLVEVRNIFEERITMYFNNNIREHNKLQSRKFCHSLLEQIYNHYSSKLQDIINVKTTQNLRQECV